MVCDDFGVPSALVDGDGYHLHLAAQFDKWIQKGDVALPSNFTVTTTLAAPEGVVLGGTTATGSGTGKVSGDGSGTRKGLNGAIFMPVLELL